MSVVRRTGGRLRPAVACGTLIAAAALCVPAAPRAAARPYDPPISPADAPARLLTRLQTYYRQAASATESYDRADETAQGQRAKAEDIDRQLADQRVAVAATRNRIGLMARQMYRGGGLSPYLSMLTGDTPQDFFGRRHIVLRAAEQQRRVLDELARGVDRLNLLNTRAQHALDTAQQARKVLATRKARVRAQLQQVEALLAGLTPARIDELRTLEEQRADAAQQDFLDSKALGAGPAPRAPSLSGDRAVGYAVDQLGKPYGWGTQGPRSFDCSGLTWQAWAHAGVSVPRTSQQQWARLRHVPLAQLRPGDLVIYFEDASHVALYIGDGLVVQAPRPGAAVRVSPIAAAPILGAVRPDPGAQPLRDYTPRPAP